MEHFLKQNNAVDIYEEYFSGMPNLLTDEPPSTRTISILRDPSNPKRTAAHISWYPDGTHKLAAAYSVLEFQKVPEGMSFDSYIWEIGMWVEYVGRVRGFTYPYSKIITGPVKLTQL